MHQKLANLIYPTVQEPIYYEKKYPKRDLPDSAIVTRFAPSPTGFVHLGSLFTSLVAQKVAKQTNGIFFLRIEDTDGKREVENGITGIITSLKEFEINSDEGNIDEENEIGNYGPYKQSQRKEIYQTYAKYLIEQGLAYPCFCKQEELDELRSKQEHNKIRPGYYGQFAKCRALTIENMIKKIENGEKYIIRLKSSGDLNKKIKHIDLVKGEIEFPENDQDIVIIKSDGLPTYHFAHVVDDHLMRTTHVIRGDEWIASLPVHLELFEKLKFILPKFAHLSPIMKEENGNKRKLSKRKDQEAAVGYYAEVGISNVAVIEYLFNIANSNFEQWRKENLESDIEKFDLKLEKMSVSGALFDMVKLLDISKNIISKLTAKEIYSQCLIWAEVYDEKLANLLKNNKELSIKILNIERNNIKPRKDIAKWSEIYESIVYMFDELFLAQKNEYVWQNINDKEEIKTILTEYINNFYDINDEKQVWFDKIKDLSEKLGYAKETKSYKKEPEKYKGHVGDISMVIRIALTGRQNTPDMYEIMKILGKENIKKRFEAII